MWNQQRAMTNYGVNHQDHEDEYIRDIHALSPPLPPPPSHLRRVETWETSSQRSTSLSVASIEGGSSENFSSISREFNALVVAGSTIANNGSEHEGMNLGRIGEEDLLEDTNPLAIVPDNSPMDPIQSSPRRGNDGNSGGSMVSGNNNHSNVSMHRVKKEEVETKISAWQNAKVAKINNRFKREDAIIYGWENEHVQQSTSKMKRVERKLEEKRARALEKMENNIARAHRKAEEKRASAEAKRGTKVARIFEIANLMRVIGRAPTKRPFF